MLIDAVKSRYTAATVNPVLQQVDEVEKVKEKELNAELTGIGDETERVERTDVVSLSETGIQANVSTGQSSAAQAFSMDSKPKDSATVLTQRLVAASGQFEVRQIMADANKNLVELKMTSAMCKGEDAKLADAYIKRLEKLLSRAVRKIDDLNDEDLLKLQKSKAELNKQKARVAEIKAELRRKQNERKKRENGYLFEDTQERLFMNASDRSDNPEIKLDAASEAAIEIQAQAMAEAEAAVGGVDTAFGGGGVDITTGAEAPQLSGGDTGGGAETPAPAPAE